MQSPDATQDCSRFLVGESRADFSKTARLVAECQQVAEERVASQSLERNVVFKNQNWSNPVTH